MMTREEHRHAMFGLCIPTHDFAFRKVTDPAHSRMLNRTAKEQLAEALRDANRPINESVPDAETHITRAGVLS